MVFRQLVARIANHCHTVTRNVFKKNEKKNKEETKIRKNIQS